LLLEHLARGPQKFSVDVYDREGRFARGIAYSTARPCHLLNVRAGRMSGLEPDPEHFVRWAGLRGYEPAAFAPRHLYGDYLESLWAEAEERLDIRTIKADVKTCRAVPQGYEVEGQFYDSAVLASGNVQPLGPAVTGNPAGYYPDPWTLGEELRKAHYIALIGAGLTAVDAILSLADIGFQGQISLFSRHASLPHVHTAPQGWELSSAPEGSPLRLLRLIRAEVERAAGKGIPWQSVIDALRPHTNRLWQGFTQQQKAGFQRHLYTIWGVHRHRMAPRIAAQVAEMKLNLIPARVRTVSEEGITLQSGERQSFDAVINCMGYRYAENGRRYETAFRIGPARFGELFETTAIPEIRAQAAEIAQVLGNCKE
jgi:uncharacterized NAD(P)/FAD-binding protein YdhS